MIREVVKISGRHYYRLNYDGNGNTRTVVEWWGLGFPTYDDAIFALRQVGGKRYRGREIGGGIVFQESPASLAALLTERGYIAKEPKA